MFGLNASNITYVFRVSCPVFLAFVYVSVVDSWDQNGLGLFPYRLFCCLRLLLLEYNLRFPGELPCFPGLCHGVGGCCCWDEMSIDWTCFPTGCLAVRNYCVLNGDNTVTYIFRVNSPAFLDFVLEWEVVAVARKSKWTGLVSLWVVCCLGLLLH